MKIKIRWCGVFKNKRRTVTLTEEFMGEDVKTCKFLVLEYIKAFVRASRMELQDQEILDIENVE